VRPRPEPVPSVGVDPDEDGLKEEGEPLKREAEPEHVAEVLHPDRPEQPKLEGEDGARDDADREKRQHDPRPAPGEGPVERIARAQVPVLGDEDEHGERDAEAHQRDVHGQRQRLHLPRLEEVLLVDAHR
jgi:hypothetical protein